MKKTATKILALLLTVAMVLSLGLTATAASVTPMSTGSGYLGVFRLNVEIEGEEISVNAFLMEDDGYVYLLADSTFAKAFGTAELTLQGVNGYLEPAKMVGSDAYFTYLTAPDLVSFDCFKRSENIAETGEQYVNIDGAEVSKITVDLTTAIMSGELQGIHELMFVMYPPFFEHLMGSPLVKTGTKEVFGFCTGYLDPDSREIFPAFVTIGNATLNKSFALGTEEGNGGNTETQPSGGNSGNGGGNGGNTETQPSGGNSGNGGGNGGNTETQPSGGNSGNGGNNGNTDNTGFNPIYLVIIAVVVVAGFLIFRSSRNTTGSSAVSAEAVAPARQAGPVPVKSQADTIPLNPPLDAPVPVAAVWQLRAVDGSLKGQIFPITGNMRLGRTTQCQVVFPTGTPGISSNHCEVAIEGGRVVLRDLGSSYGTFCKGNKLSPNTACYLNPGDTFTMAQSQTFRLENAGAAAPAQGAAIIAVRDSQGKVYRTGSGRMTFGRADGNKVQFPADDKSVSSKHCVLYKESGKLYLMDLDSTNGTFLGEKERLQTNVPIRIRKGMAFYLANRQNTFVVTED